MTPRGPQLVYRLLRGVGVATWGSSVVDYYVGTWVCQRSTFDARCLTFPHH